MSFALKKDIGKRHKSISLKKESKRKAGEMNYNIENHEYGEIMNMSTIILLVLRTKKELAPVIIEDAQTGASLKGNPSFSNPF